MADVASWVAYYEQNRLTHERQGFDFGAACALAPEIRIPLIASVQRFQLGESGDGTQLLSKAGPEYRPAAALFVAEEQRHAELLLGLLGYLGGPPIRTHWSDAVFVRVRRLLGLRTELMILTVAEVIALSYYGALAARCPDRVVSAVASAILADEHAHVRFHCERLCPVSRLAIALWWVLTVGTAAVVAVDHRRLLAVLDYPPRRFVRDVLAHFGGVVHAVRP